MVPLVVTGPQPPEEVIVYVNVPATDGVPVIV